MPSRDNTTLVIHPPAPVRVGGAEVALWCRDTVSCLQASLATVLRHGGHDPLQVLGPRFEFRFVADDRPAEEFYYPCGSTSLRDRLFGFHDVGLEWHVADCAEAGFDALRSALAQGSLPIVAVDNYHLPFRPAHGDVHAAHLVVVCAVEAGAVTVSDAMPPAFQGRVDAGAFASAWFSDNPPDREDVFFSGRPIGGRWLHARVPPPEPQGAPFVPRVLERNLATFHAGDDEHGGRRALGELRRHVETVVAQAHGGDDAASLAHLYPYGWPLQAQASLHAEWLRSHATGVGGPALAELAAAVDRVCTAWTPLRVGAAHHGQEPGRRGPWWRAAVDRLAQSYEAAFARMERLLPGAWVPAAATAPVGL